MNINWIYLNLFLILLQFDSTGQIQNGSFENWVSKPDSSELPLHWDALLENTDSCVTKSINSSDGVYSLKLSSRNLVEGFFGPAYIGTKFKPINSQNRGHL